MVSVCILRGPVSSAHILFANLYVLPELGFCAAQVSLSGIISARITFVGVSVPVGNHTVGVPLQY